MQRIRLVLIGSVLLANWMNAISAAAQQAKAPATVARPGLRSQLLARMNVDQAARFKMIKWAQENNISLGSKQDLLKLEVPEITEMKKIDEENRQWLEKVIQQHGWPGKTLVGTDGAHAAWLLVQHADDDRQFQKRCLTLMEAAAEGEVAGVDIAYLVDRVRVGEGKKQLYGTQAMQVDGKWTVREVEDPENLDARRAKMGMASIDEYLKLIEQIYSKQKQPAERKQGAQNEKPGK